MRRSELVEGTRVAWEKAGEGEPLILVHGISESRGTWRHQVPAMARQFATIAVDVRGFGDSEAGDADGTPAQFARDLAHVVRGAGRQARVIGFSMGGVIAMRFAIDFPDLAAALVIASSSAAINEGGQAWFLKRREAALSRPRPKFDELNRRDAAGMASAFPPALRTSYVDLRTASVRDAAGYANACSAMASLRDRPLLAELELIACPTLVMTGEADPNCPPTASMSIHRRIPGSRLEIIPGLGHLAHWQDPEAFNRACLDFLVDTSAGGDGR